jgi:PhoPQ-activated pathogenicity-related protein
LRNSGLLVISSLAFAVAASFAHFPPAFADGVARAGLAGYVAAPDASYGWRQVKSRQLGATEVTELLLNSQTWRGIPWKHQLIVFRPPNVEPATRQAFLFIHGGRWKPEYESDGYGDGLPREARIFARLAGTLRAPVVVLRQVPFQPLFERREDALIAYTFDHYLKTGEADWPLLLPMVKSAARAMDAVQELSRERWPTAIERFTVAGASKRGWTSWLTAAVDSRVASVAPMVIDMLNLPAQIELQRATFGELSEEVRDYADIDLPGRIDTERGRELLALVDPYSYRERIAQPKLILLATNDRYWPLDALKLYWDALPEPKRVLYVPNQGHGVRDFDRLIGSLSALHRYSSGGAGLPALSWRTASQQDRLILKVKSDRRPRKVRAWTATSPTRDFREARWTSHRCKRQGTEYACTVPLQSDRLTATFAEMWFRDPGQPAFPLTTSVCIAGGPRAPASGNAAPESRVAPSPGDC